MVTRITTRMSLINTFLHGFTEPGQMIFKELTTAWVLCTARHTVSGMLAYLGDPLRRAHDAYHRFLPDGVWQMVPLWRILAGRLLERFYARATALLAVDDTLFHHSGKKITGAGWFRDAVRSTARKTVSAWGLNVVVLTLQIPSPWGGEPLALPPYQHAFASQSRKNTPRTGGRDVSGTAGLVSGSPFPLRRRGFLRLSGR